MTDHTTVPDEAVEAVQVAFPGMSGNMVRGILAAALPLLTDAARAEVERLRRWKAEAVEVMSGLQEVGKALGVGLGKRITARETVDKALDLRNERDEARAQVASVLALADEFGEDAEAKYEDAYEEGRRDYADLAEQRLRAAVTPEGVAAHEARIKAQALREAANELAALWPMGARLLTERAKDVERRA
jgi:hypothetical protein